MHLFIVFENRIPEVVIAEVAIAIHGLQVLLEPKAVTSSSKQKPSIALPLLLLLLFFLFL